MQLIVDKHRLDEYQSQILDCDGNTYVDAGAGAGKTRMLVAKIDQLIDNGVEPKRILAVTFTNKAAAEIKERLGREATDVHAMTIHSFCLWIMRHYGQYAGVPRTFSIIDQQDAETIVKRLCDETGLAPMKPRKLLSIFDFASNSGQAIDDFAVARFYAQPAALAHIEKIFNAFTDFKSRQNLYDFGDMLMTTQLVVEAKPEIMPKRFDWIFLDEYQDVSRTQDAIFRVAAAEKVKIVAVGDVNQSLYEWRAAEPELSFSFCERYDAKLIHLNRNWRSTNEIVAFASSFRAHCDLPDEFKVPMEGARPDGVRPAAFKCDGPQGQAVLAANLIERCLKIYEPYQVAALYRTNRDALALEAALSRRNVSYVKYGGLRYNELAHVKDLIAIWRTIVNPEDHIAFMRTLTIIPGIGPKKAELISKTYRTEGERALYADMIPDLSQAYLQRLKPLFKGKPFRRLVHESIDNYLELLPIIHDNADKRIDDIQMLRNVAQHYKSFADLVGSVTLDDRRAEQGDPNSVVLSTVHSAKGLEFKAVIVLNCSRGLMPRGDNPEEQRVFYVAITRAEDYLAMLCPTDYYDPVVRMYVDGVSPFLEVSSGYDGPFVPPGRS